MRFLFCSNTLQGFCNFRLDVVEHLIGKGNEAIIVYPYMAGDEGTLMKLSDICRSIECRMSPNGRSLIRDAGYFQRLLKVFKREKPDLVFNYTVKPNIYGDFAASILGIPAIAIVPGLGYSFAKKGLLGIMLRKFYVLGLSLAKTVFVLNASDRECLIREGLKGEKIVLLKGGEGINLQRFPYSEGIYLHPRFLMISRLLYDKGYREFVTVAERIKAIYPDTRFEIAGSIIEHNPAGVPRSEVENDVHAGRFVYLGHVDDISKELSDPNTVVVIPSYYREGMNRSLMEACSSGRPIITTNLPGLKELVNEGENGFLVEPQDVDSLFEKVVAFMKLPVELRVQMGQNSRKIAESCFSIEGVLKEYDSAIDKVKRINV